MAITKFTDEWNRPLKWNLTKEKIAKAQHKERSYRLVDGNGLYIDMAALPSTRKTWRVRFHFGNKPRIFTLGPYPLIPITQARYISITVRQQARRGIDPVKVKQRGASYKFREVYEELPELTPPPAPEKPAFKSPLESLVKRKK
ncbi:integrase arm-type DNA-binding domain-containing protein [Escherichia coli]|nr:integrase arm-type DNA-binding domain-containing protein [Escherichia coli]